MAFSRECIRLGLSALILGSGSAGAITIAPPPQNVAVAVNASVDVPLAIHNEQGIASGDAEFVFTAPYDGYSMEMLPSPGCSAFHPYAEIPSWSAFTIGALGPGETRTCTMRIRRAAGAIDNGYFNGMLAGTSIWINFNVGTFVDIALSAQQVSASLDAEGSLRAVVRVQARNSSGIDVDGVAMGLGPICIGSPIAVDTDLPGGCTADQVACEFTGGPAPAARFPVIVAGGSQSCLVRFTAPAGADRTINAYLSGNVLDAATGGSVGDSDDTDNHPVITLSAQAAGSAQAAPALSPPILVLLGVLFGASALVAMRRRDDHARNE